MKGITNHIKEIEKKIIELTRKHSGKCDHVYEDSNGFECVDFCGLDGLHCCGIKCQNISVEAKWIGKKEVS
jgi:hypothetical protein